MDNGVDGKKYVRAVINDGGSVARPYADGGLAGRISRLDHCRSACGKDDVRFFHYRGGHFKTRFVYPTDYPRRSSGFYRRVQHNLRRRAGAFLGAGVRRNDNTVTGFKTNQCLKNRRGSGVGGWNYRSHKT